MRYECVFTSISLIIFNHILSPKGGGRFTTKQLLKLKKILHNKNAYKLKNITFFSRLLPLILRGYLCFFMFTPVVVLGQTMDFARIKNSHYQTFFKDMRFKTLVTDKDGMVWMGGESGLMQFDGTTHKSYFRDPANPNSLCNNSIMDLHFDKDGLLWILTNGGGLSCFDRKQTAKKAFTNFTPDPKNPNALRGNNLSEIAEDENGIFWMVGGNNNLVRFDPKSHQFRTITEGIDTATTCILYIGNGQLFVGTRTKGLLLFDTRKEEITKRWAFADLIPKTYDAENMIVDITFDEKRQTLWVLSAPLVLVCIDLQTGITTVAPTGIEPQSLKGGYQTMTNCLMLDDFGNIWIGHNEQGVYIYNPTSKKIIQNLFKEHPTLSKTLPLAIHRFVKDPKNGFVWIVTTNGLVLLDPLKNQFEVTIPLQKLGFKPKNVRQVAEDGLGNVWFMSDLGIVHIEVKTGKPTVYPYPIPNFNIWFANFFVFPKHLFLKAAGNVWSFNFDKKQFEIFTPFVSDWTNLAPDTLANGEPIVWATHYGNGLYQRRQNGQWQQVQALPNELRKIISLNRSANGTLWLNADDAGLVKVESKMPFTFKLFAHDTKNAQSLAENVTIYSHTDAQNKLWIATMSSGVCVSKNPYEQKPTFQAFPLSSEGNSFISKLFEDADGNIWAYTSKGYYLINAESGESTPLSMGDDILPKDWDIVGQSKKGLWIATADVLKKIGAFNPILQQKKLTVLINKLAIGGKDASERLTISESLQLTDKENFFSLTFAAINFRFPQRYHYYYKLDGFDKDWIEAGNQNVANYTDVKGGNYTFNVKITLGGATHIVGEASLPIKIASPFWQTTWFRFLMAISIIGLGYAYYRSRLDKERLKQVEVEIKQREAEFKGKLAEVEMTALRSQMNPHFVFNCLNAVKSLVLQDKNEEAATYITKFARLVRLVLENSRNEWVKLEQELEVLTLYLDIEKMRFNDGFHYWINIEGDVDTEGVKIPPMLIQPYVENAIWHGLMHKESEGNVTISIAQKTDNLLEINVLDDGVGREKAMALKSKTATKNKSLGMEITSDRLNIINHLYGVNAEVDIQDLKNKEDLACGTNVRLRLNIQI
jgi:ligand-binding sensor domain-containing protein